MRPLYENGANTTYCWSVELNGSPFQAYMSLPLGSGIDLPNPHAVLIHSAMTASALDTASS